jgi:hypothetical protein
MHILQSGDAIGIVVWIKIWVLSSLMLTALEGFHQRVAPSLAGRQPYLNRRTGEWIYPLISNKVLEEVGMYSIH